MKKINKFMLWLLVAALCVTSFIPAYSVEAAHIVALNAASNETIGAEQYYSNDTEGTGINIEIECEDLDLTGMANYVEVKSNDATASNGGYLFVKTGTNYTDTPSAGTYEVKANYTFDKDATVNIWIRAKAGANSSAFYSSINGGEYKRVNCPAGKGKEFNWVQLSKETEVKEGTLTIDLHRRNDQVCFDKIIITEDLDFTPVNMDDVPGGGTSAEPTATPAATAEPTATPTVAPTATPTAAPTATPTAAPTATPTVAPTATPTAAPTATPTVAPTATPTATPSVDSEGTGINVEIECEDLDLTGMANYVEVKSNDVNASNGGYLFVKAGANYDEATNGIPSAGTYEVKTTHTFDKDAKVSIWIRAKAGAKNYRFYSSINGGDYAKVYCPKDEGKVFKWIQLSIETVKAGETLTIDLHRFNDQVCFDKIIITEDLSFAPVNKDDVPNTNIPGNSGGNTGEDSRINLQIECENLVDTSDSALVMEEEDASKGKYLLIKSGFTQAEAPEAGVYDLRVSHTFEKDAVIAVWVRARYGGNKTFAIYSSINEGSYARINIDGSQGYKWTRVSMEVVKAGDTLTLDLYHRNDQVRFDKIIITDDTKFYPEYRDDVPTYEAAESWGEVKITPPSGHPRIYVTQETLPALKEKVKKDIYKNYLKNIEKSADALKLDDYNIKEVNGAKDNLGDSLRNRSFLYLVGLRDEEYGRETIARALKYAETLKYTTNSSSVARRLGNSIWALAIVYDYHYDLLEESEKEVLITRMKYLCSFLECGYPINTRADFGHGCEYMIYRDMMSAGAAVYDEDKEIWNNAAPWFDVSATYRRFTSESGNFPEGSAYASTRSQCEYYALALLKPWGIPDSELFGDDFDEKMLKYLYLRLPTGEMLFDGDGSHITDDNYSYDTWVSCLLNVLLYPDSSYYKSMVGEWLRSNASAAEYGALWVLLFGDLESIYETKAEFDTLPLSWMGNYPFTHVMARTGWSLGVDSPTVVSLVKGRELGGEYHLKPDNGSFQIYYKGILAANTIGDSNGVYNSPAERNYSRRTIAANCVTVTDPNELFFYNFYAKYTDWYVLQNDGGQSIDFFSKLKLKDPSGVKTKEELEEIGALAETQGKYSGPNANTPIFTYLKSDLTNSYGGTMIHKQSGKTLNEVLAEQGYTELIPEGAETETVIPKELMYPSYFEDYEVQRKVDSYKRATVFVDTNNADYPAAFICFDMVDAREASFDKKWLLHGVDDMTVDGNVITIINDERDYNGKLVNVTMLPEDVDIALIGGVGMEAYFNGVNYYTAKTYDYYLDKSKWRAEVSPSAEQDTDIFLNAMYVTDADGNLPQLPMYKESTDQFVGVTVLDNVVMFAKTATSVGDSFTLTVRDNNEGQTMHCLITDVAAGVWTVIGGGKTQNVAVTAEENSLYFEGIPGTYTIAPATAGTEADNTSYPELEGKWKLGDFNIFGSDNFMRYNEYPTKDVNGVAYVEAEGFFDYYDNVQVTNNGDGSYTIQSLGSRKAVIWPGDSKCILNGEEITLEAAPFMEGDLLYVAPAELVNATGVECIYYPQYYTLKVIDNNIYYKALEEKGCDISQLVFVVSYDASSDDGNVIDNMFDNNLESRWTSNGDSEWALMELEEASDLKAVYICYYSAKERASKFDIEVSSDGVNWKKVLTDGESDATKINTFERFELTDATDVKYIRYLGKGNSLNLYNSISEFVIEAAPKNSGETGGETGGEIGGGTDGDSDKTVEILMEGTQSYWTQNTDGTITIHCSGDLADFIDVEVDGLKVVASNYTLEEGSTILTFKTSFLDTLSVGDHTVVMNYTNNRSAKATLTVLFREEDTSSNEQVTEEDQNEQVQDTIPATGDDTNYLGWILLLTIAAMALIILSVVTKRRMLNSK